MPKPSEGYKKLPREMEIMPNIYMGSGTLLVVINIVLSSIEKGFKSSDYGSFLFLN